MSKIILRNMLYLITFSIIWSLLCISIFPIPSLAMDIASNGGALAFGLYLGPRMFEDISQVILERRKEKEERDKHE